MENTDFMSYAILPNAGHISFNITEITLLVSPLLSIRKGTEKLLSSRWWLQEF